MLTGAILAGGKSVRYGRNKALEGFKGKSLIEHAVTSMVGLCDPVLVVANDLTLYLHLPVTLVQDVIPHQGPLGGIYTALLFSPHPWVLAKATDMPLLVKDLARMMVAFREGYDVVLPLLNDRHEPLLALYSRRCLASIAMALEKGERRIISFFPKVKVRVLSEAEWRVVDPKGLSFSNINTPENLEQLRWI